MAIRLGLELGFEKVEDVVILGVMDVYSDRVRSLKIWLVCTLIFGCPQTILVCI